MIRKPSLPTLIFPKVLPPENEQHFHHSSKGISKQVI